MTDTATTNAHDIVTALCVAFKRRAATQQIVGKTRDKAAIEFFVGACSLAEAQGNAPLRDNLLMFTGMILCARGYRAIEERAGSKE